MTVNVNNVLTGIAQFYYAPWGLTTPGQPEPMPSDPGASRTVADGVTNSTTLLTSATAAFTVADQGGTVTGTGIPAGTYIVSRTSATNVVMSQAATASGTGVSITVTTGVATGGPWGGAWIAEGATDAGVTFTVTPKENDIYVEEQSTPALTPIDTMDVTIDFTSAEDVMANMLLSYGVGTITTQAATTTVVGKSTLTLGLTSIPWSVGFEAVNSFGLYRRVYIPKALSAGTAAATSYRRAKAERMYAVKFRAICPQQQILIVDQTSAHT